jgi:hypothetical protein
MSQRTQNRFNHREVARALRGARLAGERPDRVEIDPATGRITVIIAKSGATPTPAACALAEATEKELKKAKGQARRAPSHIRPCLQSAKRRGLTSRGGRYAESEPLLATVPVVISLVGSICYPMSA